MGLMFFAIFLPCSASSEDGSAWLQSATNHMIELPLSSSLIITSKLGAGTVRLVIEPDGSRLKSIQITFNHRTFIVPSDLYEDLFSVWRSSVIFGVEENKIAFVLSRGDGEGGRYSRFIVEPDREIVFREDWFVTGSKEKSTKVFPLKIRSEQ